MIESEFRIFLKTWPDEDINKILTIIFGAGDHSVSVLIHCESLLALGFF